MSLSSQQNAIARIRRELADLQKRMADETKKEADKSKRIAQIEGTLTRTMSLTTLQSKQREIARVADEISTIQRKKADISKRIAAKTDELHRNEQGLFREQGREQKRIQNAERKREQERERHQQALTRELSEQKRLLAALESPASAYASSMPHPPQHDLFISHASEDKDSFVRPLAQALQRLGLRVWFDEFELKVGDSLRRMIDRGLANSRYGVVVLSGAFFAKNWPQYELDGLVAKEMAGTKVILPIWHKVSKDEVLSYSPSLADKVALNSSMLSIDEIASKLAEVAKG